MLAKPFSPALSHYGKMITNELNVGAKVKFLLGAGNIDARIKSMNVTMGYDKWQLRADGQLNIAVNGLKVPTNQESGKDLDTPDMRNQIDYDGIDLDSFGTGFGLGFDLGATYDMHKFVPGLTLSAAITDLGFISWKHNVNAATPGPAWTFDGFQNIALDSDQPDYEQNKLDKQLEDLWDDLKDCANFERKSENGSRTTALNATFTLGAARCPFTKNLQVDSYLHTVLQDVFHGLRGVFRLTTNRHAGSIWL